MSAPGAPILGTTSTLAPALDGIRLSLHVLAAAVWVGGQLTLAGLVPTARRLGEGHAGALARAFARLQWPAYGLLLATGIWNVAAVGRTATGAWQAVLVAKVLVVLVAGASAWLHTRARSARGIALWGGVAGLSSVTALVMGVFLAG
jgi:putative copper export protein